jgi:DNA-binding NtrC family response regulator
MAGPELPSFHGIIGRSAPMRELFRLIERVAPLPVPVLIRGESGTGKDLVARAIQRLGARSHRPFEIINCADLTRELLRSELFGHERSAFSGAVTRKAGILAAAHGGTLFLDEVGELAVDAQALLLRFLESGEGRPVGSTATIRADVRLIAATHRDLEAAVRQGTFREDLHHRLFDVDLDVPPLRERVEDVALLVEHFYQDAVGRLGLPVAGVTRAALARLQDYSWPGNVRQLGKAVRRAMIVRGSGWVEPEDLRLPAAPATAPPPPGGLFARRQPRERRCERVPPALRRETALPLARERGVVTRQDLAQECGISGEQARLELIALVRQGLLRRVGGGRSTRYFLA